MSIEEEASQGHYSFRKPPTISTVWYLTSRPPAGIQQNQEYHQLRQTPKYPKPHDNQNCQRDQAAQVFCNAVTQWRQNAKGQHQHYAKKRTVMFHVVSLATGYGGLNGTASSWSENSRRRLRRLRCEPGSAVRDIHSKPTQRCLFILLAHVHAGLAHCFNGHIKRDQMLPISA